MKSEKQLKIIKQGENESVEFKTSFNDEAIIALNAFANSKGGSVYIGISDKGISVSGFHMGKETIHSWINEIKSKTQPALIPDVEILKTGTSSIVKLSISEFPVKPVSFRGKYFKRVGNSNHQMTLNEITNLHLKTINLSWDFAIDPNHGIKDISLAKVDKFIEKANRHRENPITDDPLTVMKKYELLRENSLTFGAFLLFPEKPSIVSTIDAGRFDSEIIIRDILSGKSVSNPRNKLIASIFKEAGVIEKYGSGIRRVRQTMINAGANEPKFETIGDCFKVTLFPIFIPGVGGVSGGVTELLEFIQNNPGKNTKQIQDQLNIPRRTIERRLLELKSQGKISFRGAPKTGGYHLVK